MSPKTCQPPLFTFYEVCMASSRYHISGKDVNFMIKIVGMLSQTWIMGACSTASPWRCLIFPKSNLVDMDTLTKQKWNMLGMLEEMFHRPPPLFFFKCHSFNNSLYAHIRIHQIFLAPKSCFHRLIKFLIFSRKFDHLHWNGIRRNSFTKVAPLRPRYSIGQYAAIMILNVAFTHCS